MSGETFLSVLHELRFPYINSVGYILEEIILVLKIVSVNKTLTGAIFGSDVYNLITYIAFIILLSLKLIMKT